MQLSNLTYYIRDKSGALKLSGKPNEQQPKKQPPKEKKVPLKPQSNDNVKVGKPLRETPKEFNPKRKKKEEVESNIKVSSYKKKSSKKTLKAKDKKPPLTEGDSTNKVQQRATAKVKLDERVKQKAKDERFLTLRMYSYKFFNYLLKGSLDNRDPNLNGDSIQVGYSNIFTLSTVTRYYVISFLPEDTPVAFMNRIIRELKRGNFWVNLSLQVKNKPYKVDFTATHLRNKLNMWIRMLDEEYTDVEGLDGKVYTRDFEISGKRKRVARLFRSYYKLRENIGHTKESTIIFKLQTRDKETMTIADKILRQELQNLDINHYQVRGTLLDFLRGFSPVSKRKTVSNDITNRVLMTSRDIADMLPYRQGKIGDWGMWFGVDKFSGANVWLDIMGTPQAKNILIMALTGGGKSFFVSMLLVFHHALKHNMFIHDHKGNEFTHFTRSVGGLVISMTPSKTSYLSMWIIPIKEVESEDELKALYTESFSLAELEFLTLTEPEAHNLKIYKNIFNDYFNHAHRRAEVYSDKIETYGRTETLTPNNLWKYYEEFYTSKPIIDVYGTKVLIEIANALYRYWNPKGSRNEIYRNPIKMEEIKNSKVVCFDFGMAETTRESVPDNEIKLKKIFMNVASSRFTNHNKKQKEWTVKVVEEIQSADEDILKFTSQDITEGRAKNMINYVLGNASGSLTSGSQYAKNIVDNMNIQILGKLYKDARNFYVEQYGLQGMSEYLDRIGKDPSYQYCFLLNCNITSPPATAVVQMVSTSNVAESKFFKTVDYEERD